MACGAAANSRIHICKDTGGSHSLRKSCGGGRAMSLIRRRPPGRAGPARPRGCSYGLVGPGWHGGARRPPAPTAPPTVLSSSRPGCAGRGGAARPAWRHTKGERGKEGHRETPARSEGPVGVPTSSRGALYGKAGLPRPAQPHRHPSLRVGVGTSGRRARSPRSYFARQNIPAGERDLHHYLALKLLLSRETTPAHQRLSRLECVYLMT